MEGSSLLRKLSGFRSLDLYSPLACVGRRVWVWFGLGVLGMHHKSLKKSVSDWYFIGRKLGVLANLLVELCAWVFAGGKRFLAVAVEYIIFLVLLVPNDNANLHFYLLKNGNGKRE